MAVTVQRRGCRLFEPEKWNGSLLSTAPVLMFRQFGQIFYNFSAIIICCRFPIENLYSFLRKSILPVAKKLFNSFFLAKIFFSQRERGRFQWYILLFDHGNKISYLSIFLRVTKLSHFFFYLKFSFLQRERDFRGIFSYSIIETKNLIYLFFPRRKNDPISFSI